MITDGTSYDGLVYGAFSGESNSSNPGSLSYNEHGGLGFLAGWVPDTHFSERGREARLIRLVSLMMCTVILPTLFDSSIIYNTLLEYFKIPVTATLEQHEVLELMKTWL